jgi:hypothetical protein
MLELQDLAEAQQLSLSIHALTGTDANDTIHLRTLVGNQVLLILVDSGSTGSFLNSSIVQRLQYSIYLTKPMSVKLAKNEHLLCDQMVPDKGIDNRARQLSTPEAHLARPNCNTSRNTS